MAERFNLRLLAPQGSLLAEGDGCAQRGELRFEAFIAAQDVAGTIHNGGPFGDETGHDEGRPAPEIR